MQGKQWPAALHVRLIERFELFDLSSGSYFEKGALGRFPEEVTDGGTGGRVFRIDRHKTDVFAEIGRRLEKIAGHPSSKAVLPEQLRVARQRPGRHVCDVCVHRQ